MAQSIKYYSEPMSEEEISFIETRHKGELARLRKTIKIGYWVCILIPLILGVIMTLVNKYGKDEVYEANAVPLTTQDLILFTLMGMISLIFIVSIGLYLTYVLNILPFKKDLKHKIKIVEQAKIKEKKYMHLNNSYHFYLDAAQKLSMEVSEEDYKNFEIGDEINLEYAQFSKEEFGYF